LKKLFNVVVYTQPTTVKNSLIAYISFFFNLFAAAEPYISLKITHGTPWSASPAEYAKWKAKWKF